MTESRSNRFIRNMLSLLLPVALFLIALILSGLDTPLPQELTMRYQDYDYRHFDGILFDIKEAYDFSFNRGLAQLIGYHVDPFFFIAICLPRKTCATFLTIAYFVRMGFASFMMQNLMHRKLYFNAPLSILYGVIYSLSSVTLLLGSYSCIMNLIVVIPLVIEFAIDFVSDSKNVIRGIRFSFVSALAIILAGGFNLYVIPFIFCLMIFVISCLSDRISQFFIKIVLSLPYIVCAFCISAFSIVNTFSISSIAINGEELENFEFRATFYDYIMSFLPGTPITTRADTPATYMTVFVLVLVLCFLFNSKIPLRARITLLFISWIYVLTFTNRVAYRCTVLFESLGLPSEISSQVRFLLLGAILLFASAIGLRNIVYLDRKVILGVVLGMLFLVIFSNNYSQDVSPSIFNLYYTALCVICVYVLLSRSERYPSSLCCILVILGMVINLIYILPISSYGVSKDEDSVIFDEQYSVASYEYPYSELNVLSHDVDRYMVLRDFSDSYVTDVEMINNISSAALIEPIFMPLSDVGDIYVGGTPLINGDMLRDSDGKIVSYKNVNLNEFEQGKNVLLYTNHKGKLLVEIAYGEDKCEYEIMGPCYMPLDTSLYCNFQVTVKIPEDGAPMVGDKYELVSCSSSALSKFVETTRNLAGDMYVENTGTDMRTTVLTFRTYRYSDEVYVNGIQVDKYRIGNKLAFDIDSGIDSHIEIKEDVSNLNIALIVSLIVFVCSNIYLVIENYRLRRVADIGSN